MLTVAEQTLWLRHSPTSVRLVKFCPVVLRKLASVPLFYLFFSLSVCVLSPHLHTWHMNTVEEKQDRIGLMEPPSFCLVHNRLKGLRTERKRVPAARGQTHTHTHVQVQTHIYTEAETSSVLVFIPSSPFLCLGGASASWWSLCVLQLSVRVQWLRSSLWTCLAPSESWGLSVLSVLTVLRSQGKTQQTSGSQIWPGNLLLSTLVQVKGLSWCLNPPLLSSDWLASGTPPLQLSLVLLANTPPLFSGLPSTLPSSLCCSSRSRWSVWWPTHWVTPTLQPSSLCGRCERCGPSEPCPGLKAWGWV